MLKFFPGAVVDVRAGCDAKVVAPTPWEGVGSGSCMVVFMVLRLGIVMATQFMVVVQISQ